MPAPTPPNPALITEINAALQVAMNLIATLPKSNDTITIKTNIVSRMITNMLGIVPVVTPSVTPITTT